MSEREPTGPYVYQPFGSITHPDHCRVGRLWGVGGVHYLATIKGLTVQEAEVIVQALSALGNSATGATRR